MPSNCDCENPHRPPLPPFAESLRALRYLPGVFQFLELTYARFNRRIDRETARNTTIGDVLESIPEGEALVWRSAWEDWAAAWAAAFKFVKRDGCMVIPPMFAAIQMTEETPLSFMLPGERDEWCVVAALSVVGGGGAWG